jgi:hypothetical protein
MSIRPSFALAAVAALLAPSLARGQDEARVVVAKSTSAAANFSARPANATRFRVLPANADLYAGDLIVSLPGGALASRNGAVAVRSLADYDSRSALPVLETAVILHDAKDVDLDLTLDRGRVDIANARSMGSATVRTRFGDQAWKIVLESPGSRVAIELVGRWPSGTQFRPLTATDDPAKAPAPAASVVFLVLAESASVDVGGVTLALKAPPGPAQLAWNSLAGARPRPLKLDKLPEWADPEAAPGKEEKAVALALERFRAARADDPAKAVETFLASADPVDQRIALVTLGAHDDLETLGKSLVAATSLDQWDFGITVLRHWLGRSRGQDQRYYEFLTTTRGYTSGQAHTILQLLFGFSPENLAQPETYEVLIEYLIHEKPAIRNLAAWHLVRLVPEGKSIPHKPNGTLEDAHATCAAWKKLIPAGHLPPPGKKD